MKPQEAVVKETRNIAIGTLILVAIMEAVYAILGKFTLAALLGGLYAGTVGVLNFFALGLTVQHALGGIQSEDEAQVKNAKAKVQFSYSARMLAVFGLAVLGIAVLKLDPLATLLPLLFPRMTIAVLHIKNRDASQGSEKQE